MKNKLGFAAALATIAILALAAMSARSDSQSASVDKLTIAIYTPTVQFDNSAARLAYVQGLAKAVSAATGTKVDGLSFTSMSKLVRARPDFAILDGQCYATRSSWRLLANARIDGATSRPWALYSSAGDTLESLRGKKLAFIEMGCNDNDFIDNAMLEAELERGFFASRVDKADLGGAVAEVATYHGAQAVFAPAGTARGLTKVFDAGSVPNPAFVQLDARLPESVVSRVRDAVVGYRGGGAIEGWARADAGPYRALRGQMGRRGKKGLFVPPDAVQIEARNVLIEPESLAEPALPGVRQHFEKPPERQE